MFTVKAMQSSHVSGVEKCLLPLNIHATDLNMNTQLCVYAQFIQSIYVALAKERLDLNDFVSYLSVMFQLAYK